jgi:nucleoid DNA-binding protein
MGKINKADLARSIALRSTLSRARVEEVIDRLAGDIRMHVAEGRAVRIGGFGTFEPRHRAARMGCNPRTGEPVAIAESTIMGFRASPKARDA